MPERRNSRTNNGVRGNAVVLVDYDNVHRTIVDVIGDSEQPDTIVLRLIEEIRKYATDRLSLRTLRTIAFAAIPPGEMGGHRSTGAWLSNGIEAKLTFATTDSNSSAIELTLETSRILHRNPEINAFIILSGDRWFVPLAQELQRNGRFVLVACLDTPTASEELPADVVDSFFNARYLIEKTDRIGSGEEVSAFRDDEYEDTEFSESTLPQTIAAIDDSVAHQALEIIESHFGQYQEVYLTPLLRKLTELMVDEDEPKSVINYLGECGAVWLEKRRGFPHNYTVLMVNQEHPDVQEIKEAIGREALDDDDYTDESYGEVDIDEPEYEDSLD